MLVQDSSTTSKMQPSTHLYQQQGQTMLKVLHEEGSKKSGLAELLGRDGIASLNSLEGQQNMTPDKRSAASAASTQAQSNSGGDVDDEDEDDDNIFEEKELVGPAASEIVLAPPPVGKKGKAKKGDKVGPPRARWAQIGRAGSSEFDTSSIGIARRTLFPSAAATTAPANPLDDGRSEIAASSVGDEEGYTPEVINNLLTIGSRRCHCKPSLTMMASWMGGA
eukprot:6461985-Amphidinium_carterae.1